MRRLGAREAFTLDSVYLIKNTLQSLIVYVDLWRAEQGTTLMYKQKYIKKDRC